MNQIAATPNAATAETVAAPVAAPVATPATIPATVPDATEVTAVTHWTDRLFSFRCKRPAALRFRSGEFVMIGLPGDPDPVTDRSKPVMRAYSIASPAWDDELEFYSIKVADGPLTSRLQHVRPGDLIILRPKPVGTLVHDAILPGKRLWLFATGTGFAPFASLLREPETWERFDRVIVTHTCREVADLAYGRAIVAGLPDDPLIGELVGNKLSYYPTTTRQDSVHTGRITDLLRAGTAQRDLGIDAISAATDRAMICGSLDFNLDIKAVLEGFGLEEGANSDPRHYVVEKAFVG